MKKNKIGIVSVVAVALVAGYNVYRSQKPAEMSDMALANVEALASGESSGQKDCETYCTPDDRYTCIITWGSGIEGVTCPNHRKK